MNAQSCTVSLLMIALATAGCRKSDMAEQPRFRPYQPTEMFPDGASERPLVEGTVVRDQPHNDELFFNGTTNGAVADQFPFPITHDDLVRGREEFEIFCSMCHGRTGEGNGMIAHRGFTPPPSYHLDRLRHAPVGHFFQVITNGYGGMYSYSERVPPEDRWRIAAYIRALQLSQNADPAALTKEQRKQADDAPPVDPKELQGFAGPRGKVGVDQ